jgi:hypothetical protein
MVVFGHLAGEHVLPRRLVAAFSREALFVAVIDGRHTAQRQQQHGPAGRVSAIPRR